MATQVAIHSDTTQFSTNMIMQVLYTQYTSLFPQICNFQKIRPAVHNVNVQLFPRAPNRHLTNPSPLPPAPPVPHRLPFMRQ